MKHADLFSQFIEFYEQGQFQKAFRLIITHPDVRYDGLTSEEPLFRSIVNFTDACVFKGPLEAYQALLALKMEFKKDKRISILALQFLDALDWEATALKLTLLKHSILPEDVPESYQPFLHQRQAALDQWHKFKLAKPDFCAMIERQIDITRLHPWHLLTYAQQKISVPVEIQGSIPLLFLEPIERVDWPTLLAPYHHRKCFFVFETPQNLLQMFQFPEVVESLCQPEHIVYLLNEYPNEQLYKQGWSCKSHVHVNPFFMTTRDQIEEVMPLFKQVFEQCLNQSNDDLAKDTPVANWLYGITKRLLFRIQAERYGPSRYIALSIQEGSVHWHDAHKGEPPAKADLGPAPRNILQEKIVQNLKERKPREFAPKNKIRIAHVVQQVVDGGHAPTKLLDRLLLLADEAWFELYLLSTELSVERSGEYPIRTYISHASNVRGNKTLHFLDQRGVKIHVENTATTYEESVKLMTESLSKIQADIVVFHGPDEVNSLISSKCDVPIRVLFEHGTPPKIPCFDLAILSTDEVYKSHQEEFRRAGMETCVLNFCMDIREGWEKKPYSKEELGLPPDSFVMTTISNHLESRLSLEMCHAIAEILKRSPKAVYAPIGSVKNIDWINSIFIQHGVKDRVFFLGHKDPASQYARSMELYLNEFPFGSCLGMLDAMAAGCPVVSMYDPEGPTQARYGATFFGIDRVITSKKAEDYIDLACRLIADPILYQEWSQHAKDQYEKLSNVEAYVKKFEKILEGFIDYRQKGHVSIR